MTSVVIIGGGPGGYEAALVGRQLGGDVTVIEEQAMGGAAVLTDCVPSKTLIASADVVSVVRRSGELGVSSEGNSLEEELSIDFGAVNRRVVALANQQSRDIRSRLEAEGVRIVEGRGVIQGRHSVVAKTAAGDVEFAPDVILVATGTHPRVLPDAQPDGERILDWKQLYSLTELPPRLIVVGSGVTGAEFASAYRMLGCEVVLVSSRAMVLPNEDPDAARVIQEVFERGGMEILSRSRAQAVRREGDGVVVTLADGREVRGSHCLMAVGAIPNTDGIGLESIDIKTDNRGYIAVDRVSRTSARGSIYAAGDCTGVFALASVAAMQGRIAMWHALGDAVPPLELDHVSSNVFTAPEIATVGCSQADVDAGRINARQYLLPLAGNPRAKMRGLTDGFVKLFCRPSSGIIIGGVIVAPQASELIHPISLAVAEATTVDAFARAFTVYPSLSGSLAEAARRLHKFAAVEGIDA